jgi:hypothetical protein
LICTARLTISFCIAHGLICQVAHLLGFTCQVMRQVFGLPRKPACTGLKKQCELTDCVGISTKDTVCYLDEGSCTVLLGRWGGAHPVRGV